MDSGDGGLARTWSSCSRSRGSTPSWWSPASRNCSRPRELDRAARQVRHLQHRREGLSRALRRRAPDRQLLNDMFGSGRRAAARQPDQPDRAGRRRHDHTSRAGLPSTAHPAPTAGGRAASSGGTSAGRATRRHRRRGAGRRTVGRRPTAQDRLPGDAARHLLPSVRITADVDQQRAADLRQPGNYRVIEQTLRQIDRPQLPDRDRRDHRRSHAERQLNYGVQFFLEQKGSISSAIAGDTELRHRSPAMRSTPRRRAAGPRAARLQFPDRRRELEPRVILDALHGVTDVKVLSNPSLVVLDNQVATLQVGDQVPVATGTATVLTANNTGGQHHRLPQHRHHPARACRASTPTATSCSTSSRRSATSRRQQRRQR